MDGDDEGEKGVIKKPIHNNHSIASNQVEK